MPHLHRHILILMSIAFLLTNFRGLAQDNYPRDYFQAPVDMRMLLSGTFGELRSNHFHSGIDIKTNGTTGAKIYAIADGYISRINVSAFGFGKALYINHPNGYTSVYGHLDYFTGPVHDYVIQEHYSRESFEMTLYPVAGELPVKKGEVIAYSGNSGSSAGPHLHFEIRDAATQKPINPLLFGYEVKDFYRPRITWLKVYAVDDGSRINGSKNDLKIQVEGWGEEHRLSRSAPIRVSGNIAFGIQCYDQQNDTQNKNGPYSVDVFVDGRLVSSTRMETFSFDETRYINSLIDYEEYVRSSMRIQRTEIDPNNALDIYDVALNKGIIFIDDTLEHTVRYEVKDVSGNVSVLEFNLRGEPASIKDQPATGGLPSNPRMFYCHGTNTFENEYITLEAGKGAFYRSFEFTYDTGQPDHRCYSPIHQIHNRYTPVHEYISLAIKSHELPEKLRDKALVVKFDDNSSGFASVGGDYREDGFVHTRIREFGKYSIALDTIAPTIKPLNASSFSNLSGQSRIRFMIRDDLSGIRSYRGTLNGRWILMDYDAKNELLVYYIDSHMRVGRNEFRLEVIDMKGNISEFTTFMVR